MDIFDQIAPDSQPPVSLWKGREQKVLILKDSSGKQTKWHIENGKPVQMGATK